ncbi:VOC family protein [Chitinasiproducens palmae]|uniref:Catechol 2,3-dioxygenase n=1 Tax=Chitinasiproducens palmae TaxID=1770053 RepID=A0A1H2PV11_9BURK|nr:VOC family protein [Chitinasiproducens palmae]SDV50270.1 Catechol 2,3-dioxygenase [Chitinasiproducens palmae]
MNLSAAAKLNHVSFPTHDVAREAHFFEQYLGAKLEFVDPGSDSALLRHGNMDIVLEKMPIDVTWHKDFHIGLELETKQAVDALHHAFRQAGIALESEVFNRIGRGSRFFARTPGGIQIEINTREDREAKWDPSTK